MYELFINMSVTNWHFATVRGIAMTWIWTLHKAHNKLKSPIKEDNIWASTNLPSGGDDTFIYFKARSQLIKHFFQYTDLFQFYGDSDHVTFNTIPAGQRGSG